LLDDEVVPLNAGDAIVRRGTIYSGANRSERPTRMLV
jgi:hypothetical protein